MRTVYSRRAWAGFELFFRPWMARRLDGVHVRGPAPAAAGGGPAADAEATPPSRPLPDLPLLLVANHVSWWDGFLVREVHRRLRPHAPLYVVMSATELRRYPVFRWLGAVPLHGSPVGPRRLLRDLEERLAATPEALVGFFPQGRIWPSHRRPLGFRRGAAWLAERLAPIAVVPVALHLHPSTRPGPAALVAVGDPILVGTDAARADGAAGENGTRRLDACSIERDVTALLDGILAHVATHGEDAIVAWERP